MPTPPSKPPVLPAAGPDAPDAPVEGSPGPVARPTGKGAAAAPATRTSAAFKSLLAGAVLLVLLLVFILENTKSVQISYFGATGHLALGVALLLAAVAGALIVGTVGAARITQLRLSARRHRTRRR